MDGLLGVGNASLGRGFDPALVRKVITAAMAREARRAASLGDQMGSFPSSMSSDGSGWPPANTSGRHAPSSRAEASRSDSRRDATRAEAHSLGLVKMVESEIIPRLMIAHRAGQVSEAPPIDPDAPLDAEIADAFAQMVVTKEPDSLIVFVGALLRAGRSMESIYVDLLVPAARRLGEFWDDDTISFTDVTIGLGRLQQVVRALGWNTPAHGDNDHMPRSAFFAPGPGEQHTFGLFIVEDFFRRSGWRTWIETAPTVDELAETVQCHWFDVFGMSASRETHLDEMAANIKRVRKASRNPSLFILVGGKLFMDRPELVERVGADATAASGGEAFLVANEALLIADNGLSRVASGS